jgi:hypothetical protein
MQQAVRTWAPTGFEETDDFVFRFPPYDLITLWLPNLFPAPGRGLSAPDPIEESVEQQ